jgi:AhpD family alkylhydroperoxidase
MRLTPAFGVHLRGLADQLLVNDFPGATITRGEREVLATAVSAANDCFFCMDSHAAHATAVIELTGQAELLPLLDGVKTGSSEGFDPKMQALLNISRTVGRNSLELTAADVEAAKARRRVRCAIYSSRWRSLPASPCTTASSTASVPTRHPPRTYTWNGPGTSPRTVTAVRQALRRCRQTRVRPN